MKVTVQAFKAALAMFQTEFIDVMKTPLNKFIVGAALAASGKKIDAMVAQFTDAEGMVDVDAIKAIIDGGMKGCGGQFHMPINFGVLSTIGATPVNITFKLADVDKFFLQTLPDVSNKAGA